MVKKHIITVPLTSSSSIPHPTSGRFGAAKLILRPSAPGSGVIAGSSIRTVLELAGIKNILSKQLGSNNLLNNARATIDGLSTLKSYHV
jgi:small subunit ribosomal protein S5